MAVSQPVRLRRNYAMQFGDPDHYIRAIYFDLDGVLVDAADWHREAFDKALRDFKAAPLTDEEHFKTYNGLSTRKKFEMLYSNGRFKGSSYGLLHPEDFVDNFYNCKQRYTIETIEERCRPVDRVTETVEWAWHEGYRLAVVTNCSRFTCERMLQLSGLDAFFQFIITNEDVNGYVKPSPRPYLEARWKMNLGHKESLAVDDTWKGINSARDAGCRTWKLNAFEDLTKENLAEVLANYRYPL